MIVRPIASSSKGNSLFISNGLSHLLLDAGIKPAILREHRVDLVQLDGVLLTHEHQDHSKFAKELARYTRIYAPKSAIDKIDTKQWKFNLNTVEPKRKYKIGTFEIIAYKGYHENADQTECEVFMYLINSIPTKEYLFYATDTSILPKINIPIDYLIIETNHSKEIMLGGKETFNDKLEQHIYERLRRSHLSIEKVENWLKNEVNITKLKQVYLMHLSAGNSNEIMFRKKIQKATGSVVYVVEE